MCSLLYVVDPGPAGHFRVDFKNSDGYVIWSTLLLFPVRHHCMLILTMSWESAYFETNIENEWTYHVQYGG